MLNVTIDNIVFEVWGDKTLWVSPTTGALEDAPADFAKLARALVCCDYEDRDGQTYIAGAKLLEHFVDTHDDKGNEVPNGRPSGLHFPLKAGMPPVRALEVMTGKMQGELVVSVLKWDDPLDAVLTTAEVETRYRLAVGSAKKAAQRGKIPTRKTGKVWLIRTLDANRNWG